MKQYTTLQLLLACFFLYISFPYFPKARVGIELLFWGVWLIFCLLIIGAHLANLLDLTPQKEIRKPKQKHRRMRNY